MTIQKQFTRQRSAASGEEVRFEMPEGSGRWYDAAPDAPGGVMMDVASIDDAPTAGKLQLIGSILDQVLLPASRVSFEEAFRSPDPTINITLDEAVDVIKWLISEVYTGKATEPALPSPPQESVSGPNSTATAPLPA